MDLYIKICHEINPAVTAAQVYKMQSAFKKKIVPGSSHWKQQLNARETFKTAYSIFTNHKAIVFL